MQTIRYNVEHTNSNSIRAIANSCGGDVISDVNPVTSDGSGIAVIEFPADQIEYVEQMLNDDDAVIQYR